jgi:hypothetical protein
VLNNCFYIFASAFIFLSSITSIISTVESDKHRQICRFLAERQIRIRGYDILPVVFHVFIHEMILPIFEGLRRAFFLITY